MFPQALGYIGFRAKELDDWRGYGAKLLGFQVVDKSRTTLAFRMDDRKQRVLIDADGGEGLKFIGWEVADAAALDKLAARVEAEGVAVARASRALAEERRVKDLVVFNDPLGNRLELFHGGESTSDPFVPGRNISGFRTGPLGLGHIVMTVERIEEAASFYRETLGFGLSDYYSRPFPGMFFHVNPRHHSLAMIQTGKSGVHHMMVELFSFDDVGQGYDLAQIDERRLAVTLGRHAGDYMTSFYTWTPSAFMVEYGWGGRSIDPKSWRPRERVEGPSIWGHERTWLSPEKRAEARQMRLDNAAKGLRQPVQVIEGNYELNPGTCPWWDAVKKSQRSAS